MSELFEEVEGVKVIVDDLLVWGRNDEQHDVGLKQVLEVNLKFNINKCRFRQKEVPYVGHVLSKDGLNRTKRRLVQSKPCKPLRMLRSLKHSLD